MTCARVASLTALAVAASACLRQAEDRALGDLEIGVGAAGGVTFAVADGLAHIRSLTAGEIELRAQAPVLRITAAPEAGAHTAWTLTVHNCMPDAELGAVAGAAQLAVTPLGGPRPTVRAWQVDLPEDVDTVLTVAPPDHEQADPFRIAVMSDIQQGLDEVEEVFARILQDETVRMVLSAGDLVEDGAGEEFDLLEAQLEALEIPFYVTVGNHDLWRGPNQWRRRFGRFTVHFDFKGVAFSLVDSASATIDPIVYGWLDEWLAEAADRTHVFLTQTQAPVTDPPLRFLICILIQGAEQMQAPPGLCICPRPRVTLVVTNIEKASAN